MTDPIAFSPPNATVYPKDKRPLIAVLGPTNTGKTHYAIERMLAYKSGMIGLPLRLLAREIYDKLLERRPSAEIALVTGEEKIIPRNARFWICTVEAMPLNQTVEFMAIDEIQLAGNPERGRTFTSRLLYARGVAETLFLGADSMAGILRRLFPNITFLSRERFSTLAYTGPKKVTRLPRRSAIVSFSADNVYAIAELVRRQRGGAAVILGALSPRTRNAQAALYQSGEVDYLIATDAIGMGLNMDIDHIAFAAHRKFDGRTMRNLTPPETAQIAGRAGRHMRDGTFGVTADCPAFDEDLVTAVEDHQFDPTNGLFWRSEALDFSSIPALQNALDRPSPQRELIRARLDEDERALNTLVRDEEITRYAKGGAALSLLWEICQIPDFRKTSIDQHTKLLGDIYLELMQSEKIREEWLAPQVERLDRTDGDIDTLSTRIAHIRSWTYLSNRSSWLENADYWQERSRAIEDKLSDALHERLTQRFVDRRTAVLLKRLKDDTPLLAGVTEDGEVVVEGQFVGRLLGFEFIIDPRASHAEAKPVRAAAERALRPVLAARASALANATPEELSIKPDGTIWWRSSVVAKLEKGPTALRPRLVMHNIEMLNPVLRGRIEDRLIDYFSARVEGLLSPLIALQQACETTGDGALEGLTRGVAWRLVENFGATSRSQFGDDLKQLSQNERGKLRKLGLRFGEFTLFLPALLKPAPAGLLTLLWALWNDRNPTAFTPPKAGLVSTTLESGTPHAYYYASGYRPSGTRAVRIDMLERLAGEIRAAREKSNPREGFEATQQMMSLVGCSGEDFDAILVSLNFRKNTVTRKAPVKKATTENPSQPQDSSLTDPEKAHENNLERAPTQPTQDTPSSSAQVSEITEPLEVAQQESLEKQQSTDEIINDSKTVDATTQTIATSDQPDQSSAPDPSHPDQELQDVEVILWRYQPKRQHRPSPSKDKENTDRKHAKGGKMPRKGGKTGQLKSGGKPQGGRPARKIENPHMHKPRHLKTADPDSPFAVLAALKDNQEKTD